MASGFSLDAVTWSLEGPHIVCQLTQPPTSRERAHSGGIDSYVSSLPVTHRRFFEFAKVFYDRPCGRLAWRRRYWEVFAEEFSDFLDFPIVNVSAREAIAYAVWDGGTLPTCREAAWIRLADPRPLNLPWDDLLQANQRLDQRIFGEGARTVWEEPLTPDLYEEWLTPFTSWGWPVLSYMRDRWAVEDDAIVLKPLWYEGCMMKASIVSTSQHALSPDGILVSRFGTVFRVVYPSD